MTELGSHSQNWKFEMEPNVAHYSKFPQQRGGLMICGYEWGYSKKDQEADAKGIEHQPADTDVACTFANKELQCGPRALNWRYDTSIMKWFEIWGHPLNQGCLVLNNFGAFQGAR